MAAGQPGWIGTIALPSGYAVWILGTLGTSSLADGAALAVVEGALPVFSFAGALALVGGGRVWHRLAGVAVIAGPIGALNHLLQGASAVIHAGLLVAFAFLVWLSPRTRRSSTPALPDAPARSPADGR